MARDPAVLAKLPTPKFVDARVGRGMPNQDLHFACRLLLPRLTICPCVTHVRSQAGRRQESRATPLTQVDRDTGTVASSPTTPPRTHQHSPSSPFCSTTWPHEEAGVQRSERATIDRTAVVVAQGDLSFYPIYPILSCRKCLGNHISFQKKRLDAR